MVSSLHTTHEIKVTNIVMTGAWPVALALKSRLLQQLGQHKQSRLIKYIYR
jgi:hypothetical protein